MTTPHLGLALSGGGFRASFFHIGVLARMAELDLLRHVEALSTVSGGSILGVLYYLKLKNLLESKTDDAITQQDYLKLVAELETEFLTAVQKNLRVRTFSSIWHNLKMMLPSYSRSDRIGELYDKYIYRPVWRGDRDTPIMMNELKIFPKTGSGELDTAFNPTQGHNESRRNKIPVLNINSTVLNTGHDWRFTAVDMGEVLHDTELENNIDKNTRLLKARYENICGRASSFHLGKAVAASAGVPGIFPPLSIHNMYPSIRDHKPTVVQLVDGGVYDNQGIATLQQGAVPCERMIVSDASGQMRDQYNPGTGTLSVFMRTTDVLMGRVREEMLTSTLQHNSANVGLMHLTEGLPVRFQKPRSKDCETLTDPRVDVPDPVPQLNKDMRGLLSRVRTDLDSFSDVESECLMAYGHALAKAEVDAVAKPWGITHEENGDWPFARVTPWLEHPDQGPKSLSAQLEAAHQKFGKAFRLALNNLPAFLGALALFLIGLAILLAVICVVAKQFTPDPIAALLDWLKSYTALDLIKLGLIALAVYLLGKLGDAFKYLRYFANIRSAIVKILVQASIAIIFAIPLKIYLWTLDKYYLLQGRVKQ